MMSVIARQVVAIVFALSSFQKLRDPMAFVRGVAQYRILPPQFSAAAAFTIVVLEIVVAALHLTDYSARAAVVGLATLSLFAAGVAINLRRGERVSCFCFDTSGKGVISGRTLVRLAALAGCELLVVGATQSHTLATVQLTALPGSVLIVTSAMWLAHVDDVMRLVAIFTR
jgi:hypothetical protein